MTKRILAGAMMAMAFVATGCTGSTEESGDIASLEMNIISPNFFGNSVKICGWRGEPPSVPYDSTDSDKKYPCKNDFCGCFNFEPNGSLRADIPDLCPSKNVSRDGTSGIDWTFRYEVYSGPCDRYGEPTGELLNPIVTDPNEDPNPHNFACYDFDNLTGKICDANETVEQLEPGCNKNKVICVTENAEKDFNFDVCVEQTLFCPHVRESSVQAADDWTLMCPEDSVDGGTDGGTDGNHVLPLVLDCGCWYDWRARDCRCPSDSTFGYWAHEPEGCRFVPDWWVPRDGFSTLDSSFDPATMEGATLDPATGEYHFGCLLICGGQEPGVTTTP